MTLNSVMAVILRYSVEFVTLGLEKIYHHHHGLEFYVLVILGGPVDIIIPRQGVL